MLTPNSVTISLFTPAPHYDTRWYLPNTRGNNNLPFGLRDAWVSIGLCCLTINLGRLNQASSLNRLVDRFFVEKIVVILQTPGRATFPYGWQRLQYWNTPKGFVPAWCWDSTDVIVLCLIFLQGKGSCIVTGVSVGIGITSETEWCDVKG